MQKQRLLALAAAVAAVALALLTWFALRPAPTGPAAEHDRSASPGGSAPRGDGELSAEPVAPVVHDEPAHAAGDDARRAVSPDAARAVLVTVVLPGGTPADESLELFAASFVPAPGSDPDQITAAITRYLERHVRAGGGFFRARAASTAAESDPEVREVACERRADGTFLAPFESGAAKGALRLSARYAYLADGVVTIDLPAESARIEPALGAWFTAQLAAPQPLPDDVRLDAIEPFDANLFGWRADGGQSSTVGRECTVGGDLALEIGGVPPGYRYFLQIEPADFVPVSAGDLEFEPGAHVHRDYTLALGVRIEGTVVDGADAPVAGARVVAESRRATFGLSERAGISDESGHFALRAVGPGEIDLRAELDGYVSATLDNLEGAERQTLSGVVLRLDRGLTLRGRVAWPDGTPAQGARVAITQREEEVGRGLGSRRPRTSFSDVTDAEGRFARSGLIPRAATVRAEAERDGRKWAVIRDEVAPPAELALVLEEPRGVHGRVVDDLGAPLAAFRIEYRSADAEFGDPAFTIEHRDFDDAEDGRFTIDLSEGNWIVTASADGHADSETARVEVPGATLEIAFVIPRAARLAGVVVDPMGAPIAGAKVGADAGERGIRWPGGEQSAETDAQGRFELPELSPGGVTLRATSEDWAPSEPLDLTVAPGEARTDLSLALRVGGRLEGDIYAASGAPDPGRRIMVGDFANLGMSGDNVVADSAGHFVVEHLAPGRYQVIAEPRMEDLASGERDPAQMFASMKMTSVEIRDGETTHVVLGAPPKAPVRLHGRITRGGAPLQKGIVMALREGGPMLDAMKAGTVAGDGRYEMTLDEPGDYRLIVGEEMGDENGAEFVETIPEVAEYALDLALPMGAIRGRVVARDGKPLPAIDVAIEREGEMSVFSIGSGRSKSTDPDGRFEFAGLAAGRYRLRAPQAGFFETGGASYGIAVRGGIALAPDAVVDGIELVLDAPGTIAGTVRDSRGEPVARASVFVRAADGELLNPISSCTSGADGRFEFAGAAPGAYSISARSGMLAARDVGPVRVIAGEAQEVELKLEPGTVLRVSVEDDGGRRVRAKVRVLDEAGRDQGGMLGFEALQTIFSEGMSATDLRFGPLPAGKYRVLATGPGGETVNKPVTLSGQEERTLNVKLKE